MTSHNTNAAARCRCAVWPRLTVVLGAALSLPAAVCAAGGTYVAGDITATTDYVSRGVSQTLSAPALQASVGIAHENGLSAYVWGSNIDYVADGDPDDGARIEVDVVVEYEHALTERITATLGRIHYFNPGINSGLDYDYGEWSGSLTLDERHRLSLYHSDNIFGSGAPALYVAAATSFDLPAGLLLDLEVGRVDLSRAGAWGDAYNHAGLAISGGIDAFTWQLAYHVTNSHARNAFYASAVEPRAVLSITYTVW